MFREEGSVLRGRLLEVKGIGPETADSILLYAGEKPFFVVDAYTRRVFERHGLVNGATDYGALQAWFMDLLPPEFKIYNEFHALVVKVGKEHCRTQPICGGCPLEEYLPSNRNKISEIK